MEPIRGTGQNLNGGKKYNMNKKQKGGKGKRYEDRNCAIILLREMDNNRFTFSKLGEIFGINKTVVEDIYKRDRLRYAENMEIVASAGISLGYKKKPRKRSLANASARKYRGNVREKILFHYSGGDPKCACCGEKNAVILCLDHINNDGAKDRKMRGGQPGVMRWIIDNNFPPEFQILCFNCNFAKYRLGKCPHNQR